jgi:3-phosphoshikimate 1-carboxyvinyltransferase
MKDVKLNSARSVRGTIEVPGDKSISHRAAMIAAISTGCTRISNYADSEDCASTIKCLDQLGVEAVRRDGYLEINGVGTDGFRAPESELFCGNSGTTLRLMAGLLARRPFACVLTGDSSILRRPMERIARPLSQMGARISTDDGKPPLSIEANSQLRGIDFFPPAPSAQVKSCVLFAGLSAEGTTRVTEKVKTRDHTERMLRWFGVEVAENADEISIEGGQRPAARNFRVPGDISSAVFFMAAAAGLENSDLSITGVGLNPTRIAIIDVMKELGANIEVQLEGENGNEPVGTIKVLGGLGGAWPSPLRLAGERVAAIIDEIPMLAVLATRSANGIEIRNAAELRIKESDRIASVVENLKQMGAEVEEFADGFRVAPSPLNGARVESYGDHRIAMAFSVAGLFAEGETEIAGSECVNVSFPGFFKLLSDVVNR